MERTIRKKRQQLQEKEERRKKRRRKETTLKVSLRKKVKWAKMNSRLRYPESVDYDRCWPDESRSCKSVNPIYQVVQPRPGLVNWFTTTIYNHDTYNELRLIHVVDTFRVAFNDFNRPTIPKLQFLSLSLSLQRASSSLLSLHSLFSSLLSFSLSRTWPTNGQASLQIDHSYKLAALSNGERSSSMEDGNSYRRIQRALVR